MSIDIKTIKHKSVAGVISYSIRTGSMYLISILATGLLSVYLSPEDFGVYFVVTAVMGIFTFMSDIGLAATLVQKKDDPTIEELRTTFTIQQLLGLAILGICVGLTPIWQAQAHLSHDGIMLLYALAFSFVLASWKTIPSILLERKMEFSKIVIPQIVETILFYAIAVYFARQGRGVSSYTAAVVCRSLAGVVVIYCIKQWPVGFALHKDTLKRLLSFGAKFQLNDLLARIKDDLFIAVLAKFLPAYQMGLIGWAKRWSVFPYQFSVTSVVSIAFPTFSRLQDHPDLLKKALEKTLFFISLLIFPLLTGIVLLSLPLTILIPQYVKWQPALPSLAFFCLNIAFAALANPVINTLNAIGKINRTLILMTIMTIATWVLTPVFVHFFGAVGVSMAAALVASISLLVLVEINKVVKIDFFDAVWRQGLATLVMGGSLWYWRTMWMNSWRGFVFAIILGMIIYFASLAAVGFTKVKQEIVHLLS